MNTTMGFEELLKEMGLSPMHTPEMESAKRRLELDKENFLSKDIHSLLSLSKEDFSLLNSTEKEAVIHRLISHLIKINHLSYSEDWAKIMQIVEGVNKHFNS